MQKVFLAVRILWISERIYIVFDSLNVYYVCILVFFLTFSFLLKVVDDWWSQPGQHAVDWIRVDGKTFGEHLTGLQRKKSELY